MQCRYQFSDGKFCEHKALSRIWVPIDLDAHLGPRPLCIRHLTVLAQANNGIFLLDEDADLLFQNVKSFILRKDFPERYKNAIEIMQKNGLSHLSLTKSYMISIVDDHVWISHILGAYELGHIKLVETLLPSLLQNEVA